MKSENIVRLRITSLSRTPEQVTEATGIPCDSSWRIGDKRAKTVIEEKKNGWVLNSALPRSESLETHVERLLERLAPHLDKIRRFSQEDSVELSCVVYAAEPPALNFSRSVIDRLSRLGASLDIDLYLMDDDQDKQRD